MDSYIKTINRIGCFFFFVGILSSCKKFVQIDPPNNTITSETVYSTNTSAAAAVTGIYNNMMSASGNLSGGSKSISTIAGLEADELKAYSAGATWVQPYTNSLTSSTNGSSNNYFWQELYNKIYATNAILDGLANSANLTDSIKKQLIGETEFMRAFFYFYAVNLYGDVPLTTTTDYKINSKVARSTSSTVYQQILSDLKDAQLKLKNTYADYQALPTSARIRPNKGAASALLARVYLYQQKWDSSEIQATLLINDSKYRLESVGKDTVFLSNSNEAIWQLQPVVSGYNTFDANSFVLQGVPGTGNNGPVAISNFLLNSFEAGDKRRSNWIGSFTGGSPSQAYYYPYKYQVYLTGQPVKEYLMVLRLAEQYLIRAEARAQQSKLLEAIDDLNIIRQRAGLAPLSNSLNQIQVLAAVMQERRVELFTEWGHRWFDLKRTGQLDSIMGGSNGVCQSKGGIWSPNWALMPLPLNELLVNPNLVQNPGY